MIYITKICQYDDYWYNIYFMKTVKCNRRIWQLLSEKWRCTNLNCFSVSPLLVVYKITCIYIHNQAVFAWPVVPSAPHSCLLFSKKRPTRNSIGNPAYASSVHMNQCIYELWLYESSTFALHFTTTKFLSNHCVKKVLGTYIDDWFTISILVFYRKTFLQNVDLSKKNFLTKCGS